MPVFLLFSNWSWDDVSAFSILCCPGCLSDALGFQFLQLFGLYRGVLLLFVMGGGREKDAPFFSFAEVPDRNKNLLLNFNPLYEGTDIEIGNSCATVSQNRPRPMFLCNKCRERTARISKSWKGPTRPRIQRNGLKLLWVLMVRMGFGCGFHDFEGTKAV